MKNERFFAGTMLMFIGAIGLFALAIMLLWNWLIPDIFGLGTISYWQAVGLLALSKLLFAGFGDAKYAHGDRKKKHWHRKFEEKWRKMPRERHEEYMKKMKDKGFSSEEESEVKSESKTDDE